MTPKMGRPKTKQGYKRVTFYLPEFVMEYLKEQGKQNRMSASEYLLVLVCVDKKEKDKSG